MGLTGGAKDMVRERLWLRQVIGVRREGKGSGPSTPGTGLADPNIFQWILPPQRRKQRVSRVFAGFLCLRNVRVL